MKTLVVFYSRTDSAKKIALALAQKLNGDLEEIKSAKNYLGLFGYLVAGREGMTKVLAEISSPIKDPDSYDLVILGTPMWAGKMASPVRAYLAGQKDKIKKAAFFCVRGGSDVQPIFDEITQILGQKPVATLALLTKEVKKNDFEEKINNFLAQLG